MHRRQASSVLRKLRTISCISRSESTPTTGSKSMVETSAANVDRKFGTSASDASAYATFQTKSSESPHAHQYQSGGVLLTTPETISLISPPATTNTRHSYMSSLESSCSSKTEFQALKDILFGSYMHILLLLGPFAIWSYYGKWGPIYVFLLNFLVMIPLANILGEATENLAIHTGETIGGLVNATFGNAVEVVIAIFALKVGEIRVVQSSLIGSILSNLLLVLGCCFFAAGMKIKESVFNAVGASANSSLLMLSSFAMLLPTYYQSKYHGGLDSDDVALTLSHICAIFTLFMYLQLLVFQLKTHIHLFNEDIDSEESADLSVNTSVVLLLVTTLLVALFSEYLVSSIEGFTEELSISKAFVGIILLPIVGNAVEHVTAVKVAMNGKMELAMGVAVGSATQVSLFVVPVVVIAGWIMGQPMTLAFPVYEVVVYLMSIIIVYAIISDGRSNWLEGSMLLTTYVLIAISLLYIPISQ